MLSWPLAATSVAPKHRRRHVAHAGLGMARGQFVDQGHRQGGHADVDQPGLRPLLGAAVEDHFAVAASLAGC